MKMKVEEKNDGRLKYFLMEGSVYKARAENSCHGYQTISVHDSSYIEGTICLVNE